MDVTTRLDGIAEAHPELRLDLRCGQCNRRLDIFELGYDWREDRPAVVRLWGSTTAKRVGDDGQPVMSKPTLAREAVGLTPGGDDRLRWVCHPKRCRAEYTVRADRIEGAFLRAALDGQRPVVAGVDL